MENFKQKVISGFAWEASTRLIVQIASWISTIWVARILTPDDYGIVTISGVFTGLCLKVAGMGLGNSIINQKNLQDRDLTNVFWFSCLSALIIYLILFLMAPFISQIYQMVELEEVIRVAGLMIIISALGIVPRAILMKEMNFRVAAIISMFANLIVTVLTLVLAYTGWGYWSLILSTVISEVFILVTYSWYVTFIPGKPREFASVMPLFRYGLNLLSANLIGYLNSQWAAIFAGAYLGKGATGHYSMANTLARIPMSKIGELFHKIGFPTFSSLQHDLERTKDVFLVMHRYLFMITAPMFVGLAVTADQYIPLLLGEKWVSIILPIQILCVVNIFTISAQIVPRVLEGIGNSATSVRYQIILCVLTPLSMLLGVQWGLNWMLIAWAMTFPVGYIYLLKALFSQLKMKPVEFWNSISTTLICTFIMFVSIVIANLFLKDYMTDLVSVLLIKITVGVLTFLAGYYFLGRQHLLEIYYMLRRK